MKIISPDENAPLLSEKNIGRQTPRINHEHPIIMSTPMQQANLREEKEVTRRTAGLAKINEHADKYTFSDFVTNKDGSLYAYFYTEDKTLPAVGPIKCPYGHIGHTLWVREAWNYGTEQPSKLYWYKADDDTSKGDFMLWKPSIHMPKDACRMKLVVLNIKIERLVWITSDEIIKEGIGKPVGTIVDGIEVTEQWNHERFKALWNKLHGKGKDVWERDKNKFVWVVNYSKHKL